MAWDNCQEGTKRSGGLIGGLTGGLVRSTNNTEDGGKDGEGLEEHVNE